MLSLQLFGGAALLDAAESVSGPATQRRRLALLALLAVAPRGSASRDKLVAFLWPEEDRERARHFLADSVFTLRKQLGKDVILTAGDELVLNAERVRSDVGQFHEAVDRGDGEHAVALYQGPFLDGFFIADAPEFERWVEGERDRLARLYAAALEGLAVEMEGREEYARAAEWWRRLAAQDPFSSRVARRLMQALSAAGERAAALQHAQVHTILLREELQIEPDPEIEAFAAQLRRLPEPPLIPVAARQGAAPEPRLVPAEADPSATSLPPEPRLSGSPLAKGMLDSRGFPEAVPSPPGPAHRLAPSPHRRWRRYRHAVAPLLLLAVLLTSLAMWSRSGGSSEPNLDLVGSPHPVTVAVLPFAVHGDAEHAYLEEGLVTLLSTSLHGTGELRTVDPYALLSHPTRPTGAESHSPARAAALAGALGADLYVLGSVVASGGRLRITASLYRRDAGPAPVLNASAEGADVFALVDELCRQVLVQQFGTPADRLSQLAVRTTHSLPALKAYLAGEREFRAARYDHAAAAFRRAVREDPSFALAYYRLSTAAEWSFRFIEAQQAAEKAWRFSDRLSARDQQLISAWRSFLIGDADAAERLYNAILVDDPFDVEAWSGLGEVRVHYNHVRGRPLSEAVPAFEKVLQLAPNYGEARFHMLEFAAARGDVAAFDSLLSGVDARSNQALSWQAARAIAWGSPGEIEQVMRRLREAEDVVVGIAALRTAAHFRIPRGMEVSARLLARPERPQSWRAAGYLMMAIGQLVQGEWEAAVATLESARSLEPAWAHELHALGLLLPHSSPDEERLRQVRSDLAQWDPGRSTPDMTFFFGIHADVHAPLRLYLLALLSARLGEHEAAERYRRELAAAGGTREARAFAAALATSVEAHQAWQRGEPERALQLLDEERLQAPLERITLSPFFAQALDRYLRGEVLAALGRPEEALRWFASLSEGPDLLFWAPAHQRQSELFARMGRAEEAKWHTERSRALLPPQGVGLALFPYAP